MYTNKDNINILTSLLMAHGVKRAVVCPGSRNAPIVHNLLQCKGVQVYPITDERSAGYYALGMSLFDNEPTIVCVTSGSALLNLASAVSEAYHRHVPLIILSADRPIAWIGQQDGQTINQLGCFGQYVKKEVHLPEPHNAEERWYCNRLINEALITMNTDIPAPIHINVPISEPLFEYTINTLPIERKITNIVSLNSLSSEIEDVLQRFLLVKRPLIVLGQLSYSEAELKEWKEVSKYLPIISDVTAYSGGITNVEDILKETPEDLTPDFVLYYGGTLIGKELKYKLRLMSEVEQWTINQSSEIYDTFTHLRGNIKAPIKLILSTLLSFIDKGLYNKNITEYLTAWKSKSRSLHDNNCIKELPYSEELIVRYFEEQLSDMDYPYQVHYGNSLSIRLAMRYAEHYVWCNRGVNGIEGSLSTAAGMSVITTDIVFCIIGDLSFFYDQNALWNINLRGNLRIILLNNGEGRIFRNVKGMPDDEERDIYVSGQHNVRAKGICEQNNIRHRLVTNAQEAQRAIVSLLTEESDRPMLVEIICK